MQVPFDYRELAPAVPAIDAVWTYAVGRAVVAPIPHIVLPDACMDVILRSSAATGGDATLLIAGPSVAPHTVQVAPGTRYVGVRFNPAWGGSCLELDPREMTDQVIPAQGGTGALALLRDVLSSAGGRGAAELTRGIAAALARVPAPDARAIEAVRLLRASGGRVTPAEVAGLLDVSSRTLRRVVTHAVGVPPATVARVFRFRRSVRLRRSDRAMSLAAVAYEAGYADQAHMTREYRELGGFSPARFPPLLVS